MGSPATRLLTLLEMLQAQPAVTGRELAARLGVDVRTARRYVAALQDIGIPVEGQRGVGGGYRIRPGYKLPPLMLSDDEAAAVVLGLLAARRYGLAAGAADGALAKIQRVLPASLARRVAALESALGFTDAAAAGAPVAGDAVLQLADAIRRRRRLRTMYRSYGGETSSRELSPHGVVFHAGRWYLAAHDHTREELRTFRIDRMHATTTTADDAVARPDGFDAVSAVSRSLARVPWTWEIEVILELQLAAARERLPATLAELSDVDGSTLLEMRVESLAWMARVLAGLACGFVIRRPPELRDAVRELAERLARSVRDD